MIKDKFTSFSGRNQDREFIFAHFLKYVYTFEIPGKLTMAKCFH